MAQDCFLQSEANYYMVILARPGSALGFNKPLDILANNIKLQVNPTAGPKSMQIGMLESVWDDGRGKGFTRGIETGEAYAVNAN